MHATLRTSLARQASRLRQPIRPGKHVRAATAAPRIATTPTPSARSYATSNGESKPPSAVANFYKTFTRPVLKVLLMATLTYQIAYLTWMKLEQDEVMEERQQEVAGLEAKVDELQKGQQQEQKKT